MNFGILVPYRNLSCKHDFMRSGTLIALSSIMGVNGLKSHFPNLWSVSVKFSTKVLHIMQLSNLGFVKVDAVQAVTLISAQVNFNPCSSHVFRLG